jgi:Flp pilus assembly protein TadG
MNARQTVNFIRGRRRERERGQILVLFTLAAVVIIAMVGLVLDGGDTFAQRRLEQNAADLASVAGANAYINTYQTTPGTTTVKKAAATTAAQNAAVAAATRNGFTEATDRTNVNVNVEYLSSGVRVSVGVRRPHANNFARIPPIGQAEWDVSVTAAAETGTIDTATGAAPWVMSIDAFNPDGTPKHTTDHDFGGTHANGPFPEDEDDISWTNYKQSPNVNANQVNTIVEGTNVVTSTLGPNEDIGQHNSGSMATVYGFIQTYLAGTDVPVPITGPCPGDPSNEGCFKGWAMFHVTSAAGGPDFIITGYFTGNFIGTALSIGECTPAITECGVISTSPFGAYDVVLVE